MPGCSICIRWQGLSRYPCNPPCPAHAGHHKAIFEACLPVARRDLSLSLFLLPHLVANVVALGTRRGRQQVRAELHEVLARGAASKEGELCVQAMFTLLSTLRAWQSEEASQDGSGLVPTATAVAEGAAASPEEGEDEEEEGDEAAGAGRMPSTQLQRQRLARLLTDVPYDVLASAAFHVGAHARALQYFESHVRKQFGGGLNPSAETSVQYDNRSVAFLQVSPTRGLS